MKIMIIPITDKAKNNWRTIYKEFPLLSKKYLSVYFVDAETDNFRFIG